MRKISALSVVFATSMLCAVPQVSANDYAMVVRAQLGAVKEVLATADYAPVFDDTYDEMGNQAVEEYTLQLKGSRDYVIVGVCDQDCSDLDLMLFDEKGNQVAQDESEDDAPMMEITPRWTGSFTLKVSMYACSNAPCVYGLSVLGR